MYLYFDKTGILREQINDEDIRRGSVNHDHIYIYYDRGDIDEPYALGVTYLTVFENVNKSFLPVNAGLPTRDKGIRTQEYLVSTKTNVVIPTLKDRNLKYFVEGQTYSCFDITVPSEVTKYSGKFALTLRAIFVPLTDTNSNGYIDSNEIPSNAIIMSFGEVIFYIGVGVYTGG